MIYALCVLAGLIIGGAIAWLLAVQHTRAGYTTRMEELQARTSNAEGKAGAIEAAFTEHRQDNDLRSQQAANDFKELREKLAEEQKARAIAETEKKDTLARLEEEKKLLTDARDKLSDAFKALASETLSSNSQQFMTLAKESLNQILTEAKGDLGQRQTAIDGLVKPISEKLTQFEEHVRSLETSRQQAYTSLEEQLKMLASTQQQLQRETGNLVTALRTPQVRGQWGEMTLRRVVELSGMSEHCDFAEQVSTTSDDGRLRPDLIVHLPSDREIVVDSKVSLDAYLSAVSADSEEKRKEFLIKHAQQVRNHMNSLGGKSYWDKLDRTPEFVVMFIPGESFFAEAAHYDLSLIEDGMQKKVVPATPTTLIALLRAVAYGWRQEQMTKNAQMISDLGKQLHDRMAKLATHLNNVGNNLEKASKAYNDAVGSLENRVMPTARKFKELGISSTEDIPTLDGIQTLPRKISAVEENPELPLQE